MLTNLIRAFLLIGGPVLGYLQISQDVKGVLLGLGVAAAVIGIEIIIGRVPLDAFISAVVGAFIGLFVSFAVKFLAYMLVPEIYAKIEKYKLVFDVFLTYLGVAVFLRKRSELDLLDRDLIVKGPKKKAMTTHLVDTSVLIDGRVADVCESKFLNGALVVPRFVLHELQKVADSGDANKRARGRRGMEILARLQENPDMPVRIFDKDYPDIKEVDAKLVNLAKELGAKILTTDFNLNKIASLQGVVVLNVNDLANALRPVVLPGENMSIYIVKEGKEHSQGVAYLDDGTMVVVDEARKSVGQKITATVTSILQTSAGRMIFAKAVREKPDRNHVAAPAAEPSSETSSGPAAPSAETAGG